MRLIAVTFVVIIAVVAIAVWVSLREFVRLPGKLR